MVGALWTGISGLAGSQTALDNESNNIANVNTVGYKASRVSFADQMYQDKIGMGVSSYNIEKIYTQGGLNTTGVSTDMALMDDGFFQVQDGNETYYTRAGNFRMGEGGQLEDASQNQVQGWAMQDVTSDDITSTNRSSSYFTNDYSTLLGNKVIEYGSSIDTIVAKATDYTQTATTDNKATFTGSGYKTAQSKVSDIDDLVTEYNSALSVYADAETKPLSSSSIAQETLLNFPLSGTDLDENDSVYVTINGETYSVEFDTDNETTMKNFADMLSNVGGFTAYMTDDASTPYNVDTETSPERGYIVVEGLVPGQEFTVSEFGWTDADNDNAASKGNPVTIQEAVLGTGLGHIESVRDALSEAVSGKQMDVYTNDEIAFDISTQASNSFTYQIEIYDEALGEIVTVPASPLVLDGIDAELADVTFTDVLAGDSFTVDGLTFTAGTAATVLAADVASFFAGTSSPTSAQGTFSGASLGNFTTNDTLIAGAVVTYVSTEVGDVDNLAISTTVGGTVAAGTPTTTAGGTAGNGYNASTEEAKEGAIQSMVDLINADPDLSLYVEAFNFNGNLVVKNLDSNFDVEFEGDFASNAAVSEVQEITISGSLADTSADATPTDTVLSFLGSDISFSTSTTAYTATDIATAIVGDKAAIMAAWNAKYETLEIADITNSAGVLTIEYASTEGNVATIKAAESEGISFSKSVETQPGRESGVLTKSIDYSNHEGAGAEFLEINTTINQTAAKSDLQLRLDLLGLTDSAFGDFEVDDSGLITMTQDGAIFAIGQVAVAKFTDNRGLEAMGDNLYQETLLSGSAIFSTDNDKMADIEGGSLELSTADLSESLVNLMVFQRAFEANAKSITTADGILTTLIALKSR